MASQEQRLVWKLERKIAQLEAQVDHLRMVADIWKDRWAAERRDAIAAEKAYDKAMNDWV